MKWNPSWKKPESVEVDKNGIMYVWYLDADQKNTEEKSELPQITA